MASAEEIFTSSLSVMRVNPNMTCADWADQNFFLSPESSNTSGPWRTTDVQRAILNSMGNDAIEKVDFFKSARFGGTKMMVAAAAYLIAHKNRNTGFYQPTKGDSDDFVKTEIDPAIRDCKPLSDSLISTSNKSPLNTFSYKAFRGANAYFMGGHSANNYRRKTLDAVMLDELDGFTSDVGKEGDPTTLSWGRIKNSVFKKQIQISTPLISGFSLIEKSSNSAEDILEYHAQCPECRGHTPIEWGGPDVPYGMKWEGRDPSTVLHYCKLCGTGWGNNYLHLACKYGYWLGGNGYKTKDGETWYRDKNRDKNRDKDGKKQKFKKCKPPRHVAFKTWSAYSPFSPWSQIVQEWYDAQGDIKKIQTFNNTTLGRVWNIRNTGTLTKETLDGIIPTDDIDDIIAVTAGVDTQDDRLEIQYVGHTKRNDIVTLDYEILRGDPADVAIWNDLAASVYDFELKLGRRSLRVINAAVDTQGHHTDMVHKFLVAHRKRGVFFGINGTGNPTYQIADKSGAYKGVKGSMFFSIGVNVIKQKIFSAIRNYQAENANSVYKIWSGANLPADFSSQMTAEKMEIKKVGGFDRVVFTNKSQKRNECLDTLVYAISAKAYIQTHRGRRGRNLFDD